MKAIRLRTEYLNNPQGIDRVHPRLFWNCKDGIRQKAYQIRLTEGEAVIWDSGKTESGSMRAEVPVSLKSRQSLAWQVRLWNEADQAGEWSEKGFFEMGLLKREDWKASWITGDYVPSKKERYPVDCFRKSFIVHGQVKIARLYAAACGDYEASLGGKKVGDFCFAPGYTDYRKRIQYQTYDVASMLTQGENTLELLLADGWYRGSCGAYGITYQYGTETKALAQLEIEYEDGSQDQILTDGSWDWSNDGPIRFADHKDGETVDARKAPSYEGKARVTSCDVIPSASDNVPVREHERLHPIITEASGGKKVLDFGQNIAGYVAFSVTAREGQRIFLRFGEMLDSEGNLDQTNFQTKVKEKRSPLQQIDYVCREGLNEYKTRFAVFGFRYAELDSDVEMSPEQIEAIAVYSDLEQTGWLETSHPLINQLFDATLWSAKSNHLDIPTDCPTRERHGWTGDAQIFYNTAAYLFDFASFGEKYVRDMYDWQRKDGCLPHIVPDGGADAYMYTMNGSVGWSDAGVMIPYRMWKRYGDRKILEKYYEGMKRYAKFMMSRCGKVTPLQKPVFIGKYQKYLVNAGQSYGEWSEPEDVKPFSIKEFIFPHPEESTAYTVYVMQLMEEIADELGKEEDKKLYRRYHDGCRKAYQALVKKKNFTLETDRQAKLVRPLYFGLLDGIEAEKARKRLIQALDNYGWRLGTGFLSTPLILDVLADIDPEAAYRLLENEEIPGWLSMPKNGATSIWENWEGPRSTQGIASLNHYSKGAVLEWMFRAMCGIRIDSENHFVLAPLPGGSLTRAGAVYQSIYGRVESSWKRTSSEEKKYTYRFVVPANCTAEIKLPDGTNRIVSAGEYTF